MKVANYIFISLCILAPLIIIPYVARQDDNPYILFGIGFYLVGSILAVMEQEALYFVPVLLIVAYWYFFGFNLYSPPSIFFYCMAGGFIAYRMNKSFKKYLTNYFQKHEQE